MCTSDVRVQYTSQYPVAMFNYWLYHHRMSRSIDGLPQSNSEVYDFFLFYCYGTLAYYNLVIIALFAT